MARLDELVAKYEGTPEFDFDLLTIEIGEAIGARMDELGISRAELAQRMGVSRARVTQVLSGADNLTLRTLVAVANALDAQLAVRVERRSGSKSERTLWREIAESGDVGAKGNDPKALSQAA